MTKSETEVIYDSIKNALELSGIKVKDGIANNDYMVVNINGLKSKITIDFDYNGI